MSLACEGNTCSVPATWVCTHSRCVCFPHLHCSGSRLSSRERALSCVHFAGLSYSGSSFRVLHKSADLVGPAFCAFPSPSSSGSQELEERTLPGCSAPYPLRGPNLSFRVTVGCACVCSMELVFCCDPPGGCQPSRISGSLWIETGGLFAVWEGMLSLGPSLLLSPPPASYLRRGWACPWQASSSLGLLSFFCSANSQQCVRLVRFLPVNFLSLSCYPTV